MEQTLITDQDNALAYADEGEARRGWFQALAERVDDDLELAGFPRCPGGYMARGWNGPLREWRERFRTWLVEPRPQSLLETAIFFDHRRVAGTLDLAPLQAIVAEAAEQPIFLRAMAEQALRFEPPPMLLLRMRGESSVVDLKRHGLSPVVFLARCYALEVGAPERNTLERLAAAERAGRMDPELREAVAEAYRFLVGLRLRLQLRRLAEGRPPVDQVALSELSPVERSRLKESFRAIRGWQEMAASRWRI
jgi:CBS domain-containing protein